VSIFLFLNSKSLLFDPLNWNKLERALNEWNSMNCPQGETPKIIGQKFEERQQLSGYPRSFGKEVRSSRILSLMSDNDLRADSTLLRKHTRNGPLLKLITKINRGDRGAATLGLFPHALRKLVCDKFPDGTDHMENLSRDIVRACADRFHQYQSLSLQAERFRQGSDNQNAHRCYDPFHFLQPLTKGIRLRSTCICDLTRTKKKRKARTGKKGRGQAKKRGRKHPPTQIKEDITGLDCKHNPRSHKISEKEPTKLYTQAGIKSFLVPCPGVT
jgi:hypothetical protein